MPSYRITPEAREDLRQIAAHTLHNWGAEQRRIYRDRFSKCFEDIATGRMPHRRFLASQPDLRVVHCGHHFVFFLEATPDVPAIIVAVLHEKMDLVARVANRLR